jgi:lysophospholipase L1-like esterase
LAPWSCKLLPQIPEQDGAPPRPLSIRRKILFLGVLVSLGLGAAELCLRILMPDTDIRTALKRGGLIRPYKANAKADLIAEEFRVRYSINEFGYRDKRGRSFDNNQGRQRVLLLGDSFTEGYGVELDQRYSQILDNKWPDIELWNTARMGSSPLFYVYQLRQLLPKLKPDLVLVQLFDNDLNENNLRYAKYDERGRLGPLPDKLKPSDSYFDNLPELALHTAWKRLRRKMKGKALPRLFVKPGAAVSKQSLVFKAAPDQAQVFNFYEAKELPQWRDRFQKQERLLRQLINEFRQQSPQSQLLFLYVPHIIAFSKSNNPHSRLIEKLCLELKVPFIDSTDIFKGRAQKPEYYYYSKDLHWNARGHSLIAKELEPIIKKQLKIP